MENKKKILFITPHLSTGGAPQVTLNKIQLLKDEYDVFCVEYSLIAWTFVVQRNRIIELLGDNFVSLPEDKTSILKIIEVIQPDVISFEEFPEFFMNDSITKEIYKGSRTYKLYETTHDSSFPVYQKRFFPDKFHFVSAFNAFRYSMFDIPYEIIEYPVDTKTKNQTENQEKLEFDSSWKHVVNVGLFTPRKNQAYLFDIAKRLREYKIKFHFIGNQADNFRFYWGPLMEDKPKNCVVWGERGDVDSFLQASDLFFFGSRGDRNNKELNPIAIKEALEYKMPMMMYDLDVYCGKYNTEETITFLTGDLETDVKNMIEILKAEKMEELNEDEVIIISTYPDTSTRKKLTEECILSFKKTNRKIILTSHYPVSEEIQRMVDYYIYDENNTMISNSYYDHFYNYKHNYDVVINLNSMEKPNQSLAAMINLFNGFKLAKGLGFDKAISVVYDVILHDNDVSNVDKIFDKITTWNSYLTYINTDLGLGVETTSMGFKIDYFLNTFKDFRDGETFTKFCETLGCHNFLEHYFMAVLRDKENLWIEGGESILPNSGLGVSSNSEYMSILPIEGEENKLMFYFFTYNIDDKIVHVRISSNDIVYDEVINKISDCREIQKVIEFKGYPITVTVDKIDNGVIYKSTKYEINSENFESYKNNGHFKYKNQVKNQVTDYKIKLVHLQTTLNDDREQKSRESLSKVSEHGIEYVLHQNEPFKSLPPSHNCIRPQCVSMELFDEETANRLGTALTPSHYGCYDSFKTGILSEFDNDLEFLIVCEGDCIIEVDMNEFVDKVNEACRLVNQEGVEYFSFGDTKTLDFGWHQSNVVREIPNQDLMFITDKIIGLQCVMFPKGTREFLFNKLRNHKWDAADIYFNTIFVDNQKTMGILKERITTQSDGHSLIDNQYKEFRKK
jgi:glycosyltransferase involved in cell wall biosynthesis